MAFSDNYKNNNSNQKPRPTVYSNYRMSNVESEVDKTNLTFTFWNGMLKITIAPMKPDSSIETPAFDYDGSTPVYLTTVKARLLLDAIAEFQTNKETLTNIGVPAGKGLLYLSNGKEIGKSGEFLVVKNINEETGAVESSFTYEFNGTKHWMVKDFKDGKFDTVFSPNLEIEQLKTILTEFVNSSCGAYAYANIDYGRFDNSRINTKLELVMNKLGVETKKGSSNGGGNSYFNKSNNSSSSSSSNGGGMNSGFSNTSNPDDMFED